MCLPLVFAAIAVIAASVARSAPPGSAAPPEAGLLAGTWTLDPARSTELSPWKTLDLTLQVNGNQVTLQRRFGWGRRAYSEEMTFVVGPQETVVPLLYWPDNRHLGAYAGGDQTKRVKATWLDDGRLLRLSSDLVLDTQQGPREVNCLSDYRISANGSLLTVIELRSTRNRPVVYVFTRTPAPPKS